MIKNSGSDGLNCFSIAVDCLSEAGSVCLFIDQPCQAVPTPIDVCLFVSVFFLFVGIDTALLSNLSSLSLYMIKAN